ncbi:MAG: hypothetical protein AB7U98_07370 [Candidatus Nitrosocosmicus sp.]
MGRHTGDAISDKVLSNEVRRLINIHRLFHRNNGIFVNPLTDTEHILLLYDNDDDLLAAVKKYLNEGLRGEQPCIHGTYKLMSENYIRNFGLEIEDYEKNRKEGNLILLNLEPHYKKAIEGNLKPFDNLAKLVSDRVNKARNQKDNYEYHSILSKKVCIITDCGSLLFMNGYYEQCAALETWWHQKPFAGTYICTYPKSLFDIFPNNVYLSTLFHTHDIAVDTDGRKFTEHMI